MYDHLSKLPTTVKICRTTQGVGERTQLWPEQLTDPVVSLFVFFSPLFFNSVLQFVPSTPHLSILH